MRYTTVLCCLSAFGSLLAQAGGQRSYTPRLGAFVRLNQGQPILSPQGNGFEAAGVFNPAVVSNGDRFVMLYRAQDKQGISRLGFDRDDPTRLLARSEQPLFEPLTEWEKVGQVPNVVFVEGLVVEPGRWLVYYGAADKYIGAASVAVPGPP